MVCSRGELGKYTAQFESGAGAAFYECHKDICEHLARYLKDEQRKFKSQVLVNEIENAFSQLKTLTSPFHTQEKEVLDTVCNNRKSENVVFNFITYNYTDTLDQCLKLAQKKQGLWALTNTAVPSTITQSVRFTMCMAQ